MEAAIGEFIRLHRRNFDTRIPGPDGPRAMLIARLTQMAGTQRTAPGRPWAILSWVTISWATAAAAVGGINLSTYSNRES